MVDAVRFPQVEIKDRRQVQDAEEIQRYGQFLRRESLYPVERGGGVLVVPGQKAGYGAGRLLLGLVEVARENPFGEPYFRCGQVAHQFARGAPFIAQLEV